MTLSKPVEGLGVSTFIYRREIKLILSRFSIPLFLSDKTLIGMIYFTFITT